MGQYHYSSSLLPPPPYPPHEFWLALLATVVFFSVALTLFLWVGRRHFYRTNAAGVEEFENFRSAVLSSIVEGVVTLVAGACFMAGLLSGLLSCISLMTVR